MDVAQNESGIQFSLCELVICARVRSPLCMTYARSPYFKANVRVRVCQVCKESHPVKWFIDETLEKRAVNCLCKVSEQRLRLTPGIHSPLDSVDH